MTLVNDLLQQYEKLHFTLIDPDKQSPAEAGLRAKVCEKYGTNAVMVGGTTGVSRENVYKTVDAIKRNVKLPVILFPNSAEAISKNADYVFFMYLLNALDPKYHGGEQAKGSVLIKKWNINPISMGYVIINTSKTPTAVEKRIELDKIKINNIEKAMSYALATQLYGMSCLYLEAGSGAEKPVSNEMISAIREKISIPIIVGGGINDSRTAREKADAGADIIVNGTLAEDNIKNIEEIIKEIQKDGKNNNRPGR